jgi:hypothetical protein
VSNVAWHSQRRRQIPMALNPALPGWLLHAVEQAGDATVVLKPGEPHDGQSVQEMLSSERTGVTLRAGRVDPEIVIVERLTKQSEKSIARTISNLRRRGRRSSI